MSHFDGVATVVAKRSQVRPDIAIFGEKDWQQLAIIRRMATDLDMGIDVVGFPTPAQGDGLARSSRNTYLTPEERSAAVALPAHWAMPHVPSSRRLIWGAAVETAALSGPVSAADYVELVDAETLQPAHDTLNRPDRLLAAARRRTRLIDNLAVTPHIPEFSASAVQQANRR